MNKHKEKLDQNLSIGVIAGDNFFSYLLSRNFIRQNKIKNVILSSTKRNFFSRLINIFKKTSLQYFLYRSTIQLISVILSKYSIKRLCQEKGLKPLYVSSKRELINLKQTNKISIAFNFDMIIPKEIISLSEHGIINIHASNLPADKGISPVVWAYCRGDKEIYVSFYFINEDIDEGQIFYKEKINIDDNWSLFRTYCEILEQSSRTLLKIFDNKEYLSIISHKNDKKIIESYNSWPNEKLHASLRKNNRSYFKFRDIFYIRKILNE